MLSRPAKLPTKSCVRNPWRTATRRSSGVPKHASASLAVLDLVMASPAQPAARRSPRRLCLLSARSDDQPLPRSDQKGKTLIIIIHRPNIRPSKLVIWYGGMCAWPFLPYCANKPLTNNPLRIIGMYQTMRYEISDMR